MPDDCTTGVRPECAVELREIHRELKMIRKATVGNGDKAGGLVGTTAVHEQRLGAAEEQIKGIVADRKASRAVWAGHAWKLAITLALAWILAFGPGCATTPAGNAANPIATAAPNVEISGKLDTLTQNVKQIQTTMQTNNYAMDAERRKLEEARLERQADAHKAELRKQEKRSTQIMGIMVGLVVLMAVAPAFLPVSMVWLGYLIGISILGGSVALPTFWPF